MPKPGGVPGPNGQRIINLLDPASKVFYKALLDLGPDKPADHQYGYATKRSRRDAILQVEAWLDRLRLNKLSTATTLFDLTKAFDTINLKAIEEAIEAEELPQAAKTMLVDLHRRLRIRLSMPNGDDLQMHLSSGVLQGGGTGPRIFRVAYDQCIEEWKAAAVGHADSMTVTYNGSFHVLDIAAYADDLVRIASGKSLEELQNHTALHTEVLERLLQPRGLKLNAKKGETLLHFSGRGSYSEARRAFSGSWRGYPLKLTVKYLGAHVQDNGSLQVELQKRIASAKSGFAQFARFFQRSRVPLRRKIMVFKCVVNESLLSALEVRPLSKSDENRLEQARGMLLRRIFGWDGFGAVAGDSAHRSVTVASLRQQAKLATISSELRVRRLLWLRGALSAEQAGQTRLDLAALFGSCNELMDSLNEDTGSVSSHAPRFLHLLHGDLDALIPGFDGFRGSWKTDFLLTSLSCIRNLRVFHEPHPPPAGPAGHAAPNVQAEVVAELRCDICGAGPWQNMRALRSHKTHKHTVRHTVPSKVCPQCQRQFTTKTAAQRHFTRGSCGSRVANHGHAGALEGERLSAAAAAAQANQPVPVRPFQQRTLQSYFATHAAGLPRAHLGQPDQSAAAEARSSRAASQWINLGEPREGGPRVEGTTTESLQPCLQPRHNFEGVGSLVHPHLLVPQSGRSGPGTAELHGAMEEQPSSSGAASSSRPGQTHGGRRFGEVALAGPGSERSNASLCQPTQ